MSDYLLLFHLVSLDVPINLVKSARESMELHLVSYRLSIHLLNTICVDT
jgi:hypothetical protein